MVDFKSPIQNRSHLVDIVLFKFVKKDHGSSKPVEYTTPTYHGPKNRESWPHCDQAVRNGHQSVEEGGYRFTNCL